jgi:D-3-phosphoglycerate dehydrogenase
VDEDALRWAIKEKHIRTGLDVFDPQPAEAEGTFTDETVKLPGVYGTHHCGASTDQAQMAVAMEAVRIVKVYQERGTVENCVNP